MGQLRATTAVLSGHILDTRQIVVLTLGKVLALGLPASGIVVPNHPLVEHAQQLEAMPRP